MIGQERLKGLIKSFSIEDFPKTIMLVGDFGCGRHTIVNEEIAPLLNIPVKDLTDDLNSEMLGDIFISPTPYIYLIDYDSLAVNKFNILLKILEEPPTNAFLVVITSNANLVAPTILNRCKVWYFDPYTKEQLEEFCSNKDLIDFVKTPGRLKVYTNLDFNKLKEMCVNIFLKNEIASLSNLLSISEKISWTKLSEDKFDSNLFYDVLMYVCGDLYSKRSIDYFYYSLTNEYINMFKSKLQFDRKRMFEKYLIELKFGKSK